VEGGGFRKPWDPRAQEILPSLRTLTNSRTNLGPAHATEPPEYKPVVVNGVVVGPFEEKEDWTGVASDVVKAEGDDPATPGPLI